MLNHRRLLALARIQRSESQMCLWRVWLRFEYRLVISPRGGDIVLRQGHLCQVEIGTGVTCVQCEGALEGLARLLCIARLLIYPAQEIVGRNRVRIAALVVLRSRDRCREILFLYMI